jgi:hypothetical protein
LTETEGWRSYPPTDKFDSADELSFAGVKTFDFTLIAQQQQKNSPGSEFSYFDPVTAKYVTLRTEPQPLSASPGKSEPETTPLPSSSQSREQQALSPAVQPPTIPLEESVFPTEGLYSWETPMQRPEFRRVTLAMTAISIALAGILHALNIKKQGGSPSVRRRRRLTELWITLNSEVLDAAAIYEAALEYAKLIDTPSADREAWIVETSERRDMLKYGIGRSVALGKEERERLKERLLTFSSKISS